MTANIFNQLRKMRRRTYEVNGQHILNPEGLPLFALIGHEERSGGDLLKMLARAEELHDQSAQVIHDLQALLLSPEAKT